MSDAPNMIDVTIDDVQVSVPQGTLVIRAAEQAGIRIPRFCDHPLLAPVAACRQCLVEVGMPDRNTGELRFMPKPQPSCAQTVTPGMVVKTQHTSETVDRAQRGVMEFLLINHPLDCPVCDKGGECPLQNQALTEGRGKSRFTDAKRTFKKPLRLTSQILLDRERCILCQRCVRFGKEISGDVFMDLQGRGGGTAPTEHHYFMGEQVGGFDTTTLDFFDPKAKEASTSSLSSPYGTDAIVGSINEGELSVAERDVSGRAFASYFSGNIIQICPVGALTAASYRFRARPFDLVSTASVTEHDASGSAIRQDVRRGEVVRRMSGNDPEVNEEWITDKDRFAFTWSSQPDRLTVPLVRDEETGELVTTSWSDALDVAAQGLARASADGGVGLLPGGRLTLEDAWAWSRFARTVLGTNDIDQRVRSHSQEEDSFLAARVAGTGLGAVTYRHLERAGQVLLLGLEPEDECGSLFLRLRKGVRAGGVKVATVTTCLSAGSRKLSAQAILTPPGEEARVVAHLSQTHPELVEALRADGATILIGERAARVPGLLSVADALATATGAHLAWVPRRSGERGGIEAGLLPGLLPGGRPVADPEARAQVEQAWNLGPEHLLPAAPGRDATAILSALLEGDLGGAVVGGIDLRDFPDPGLARAALAASGFTVQLEVRRSEVSEHADVVLPVAPAVEKNGTFVNWEGRVRPFGQAHVSRSRTDRQVLGMLADEMGVDLQVDDLVVLHEQLADLGLWRGQRPSVAFGPAPAVCAGAPVAADDGVEARLTTHKPMLDAGRLQDGEPFLAATALRPVARVGADLAQRLSLAAGQEVTVATAAGSITLPAVVGGVSDGTVWLPECSAGSTVHQTLGAGHGSQVTVTHAAEVLR